ncbi:MAG TPA: hypothetical protein VGE15_10565 [Sphingobacteriaceae bacterium]
MKKWFIRCFWAALFAGACNTGDKTGSGSDSLTSRADELMGGRQCYLAIDGKDTVFLNLSPARKGDVTGHMVMRLQGKPENNGTITGQFSGDTLYADYTFTTGEKKEVFKNPMAFLKEGEKLILGVGVIETYLGRSYLSKKEPIDFVKARFRFNPATCN